MKVLSFVIAAYNSEKYLDKCLAAMLCPQLTDRLEIIIVNDGSIDATEEIAKKYCTEYPNTVKLVSQENRGHGGALNAGFAAASGKYVKAVDADDWVEKENLPELINALESCESDVVLTHYSTFDISTGEIRKWKCYPPAFGRELSFEEIMSDWRSYEHCFCYHGIAYRRDFYCAKAMALTERVFYEDHELATFPCAGAESICPLDIFVYIYRIGDTQQSIAAANQLRRRGHIEAVLEKMCNKYAWLPAGAGKRYAATKISALLLQYLTLMLLTEPDRKKGRQAAADMMDSFELMTPDVHALVKRKYRLILAMNYLKLDRRHWNALMSSGLYSALRGKKSSES